MEKIIKEEIKVIRKVHRFYCDNCGDFLVSCDNDCSKCKKDRYNSCACIMPWENREDIYIAYEHYIKKQILCKKCKEIFFDEKRKELLKTGFVVVDIDESLEFDTYEK